MNNTTKKAKNLSLSIALTHIAQVTTVAAFLYAVYKGSVEPGENYFSTTLAVFSGVFIIGGLFAIFISVAVRRDNESLKKIGKYLHEISHEIRDTVHRVSADNYEENILEDELKCSTFVCQQLSKLFSRLIKREVTVSIKLIEAGGQSLYATTYCRSDQGSIRDKGSFENLRLHLNDGRNTALDHALLRTTSHKISHFYAADLKKMYESGDFQNERQNWQDCYRSAIVVPIRSHNFRGDITGEDLGFLSIDTETPNRLERDFHVDVVASVADQLYSLMYTLRVERQKKEDRKSAEN